MINSTPCCGSARLVVLVIALMLGGVLWWRTDVREPKHTIESTREIRTVPQNPIEPPEVEPSGSAGRRTSASIDKRTLAAADVSVDEQNPLRGRVVPDAPLPNDETLRVVVETWSERDSESGAQSELERGLAALWGDMREWTEIARVDVLSDGRFETPRPIEVTRVRLRVDGDYICSGEYEYGVGGDDDPEGEIVEIEAQVGAHVTLDLKLDEISTDEEIAALEGDVIHLTSIGRSDNRMPFAGRPYRSTAHVDSEGRAVLRGLHAWEWSFDRHGSPPNDRALAPFVVLEPFKFEPDPGERPVISVPMERGVRFSGRVVDHGGRGIGRAGLSIEHRHVSPTGSWSSYDHLRANDSGRFVFDALPSKPGRLSVKATGFLDRQYRVDEFASLLARGDTTIQLERGAVIAVHVSTPDGRPAAGLSLVATPSSSDSEAATARTDENGNATFLGLAPGAVEISGAGRLRRDLQKDPGDAARFIPYSSSPFGAIEAVDEKIETLWTVGARVPDDRSTIEQPLGLETRLAPRLRGRVTGADPSWPDPVVVSVFRSEPNHPAPRFHPLHEGTFEVDQDDGEFEGDLLPGTYTAIAFSGRMPNGPMTAGRQSSRSAPEVEFTIEDADVQIVLSFEDASALRGTVRLENGDPLPTALVSLFRREQFTTLAAKTQADAAGRFEFESQRPGNYYARVESQRYVTSAAAEFEFEAGDDPEPVDIVASPAGALLFEVEGMDQSLMEDPFVHATPIGVRHSNTRCIEGDDEWAGAVGPLAPGQYIATFVQDAEKDLPFVHRELVDVRAGELTRVRFRAVEQPLARISGNVTSGGQPVEGVHVKLDDDMGQVAGTVTDTEGRFVLAAMETGTMRINVGPWAGTPFVESPVDVAEGVMSIPSFDLPTGRIEGHIAAGALSSMMRFGNPCVYRAGALDAPFRYSQGTSNGNFAVLFLPDGEYLVTMAGPDRRPSSKIRGATVTIRGGEPVRDVRLTRTEDGAPD